MKKGAKKLRNNVFIDCDRDEITKIDYESSENNVICMYFRTGSEESIEMGLIELFKTEKIALQIQPEQSDSFEIPSEYLTDGRFLHIRVSGKVVGTDRTWHNFIHIIGDASAYQEIQLEQLSGCVMQVKKGIPIVKHEPTWLEKLLVLLTRRSIEATEQNCYYAVLATYDTTAKELQDNGIDTSDCQTIAELIDKYKEYYEKEVAKTLDHYRQVLSDIYDAIVSRGLMFPKDNIDDYADQIRKLKKVDLQIQLSEEIKQVLVDADVKIIDKLTDKVENNLLTPSRYALSESLNSSNLLVTVQNSINITDTLSVTMTHTES
jgi:hypothetical protein|nr:MAG TPA: hypothetical protein [Caudoviricetes sp.]